MVRVQQKNHAPLYFILCCCFYAACWLFQPFEAQKLDLFEALFTDSPSVRLAPKRTLELLRQASKQQVDIGNYYLREHVRLAGQLLGLAPASKRKCSMAELLQQYELILENTLLKPKQNSRSNSTIPSYSNAYNFVLHYREEQFALCAQQLETTTQREIQLSSPTERQLVESFYAKLQAHESQPELERKLTLASLDFLESQVDLPQSSGKLNKRGEREMFAQSFVDVVIGFCRSLRRRVGIAAKKYSVGSKNFVRLEAQTYRWLETELVCERILCEQELYQNLVFKEALRRRGSSSLSPCSCFTGH